MEETQSNSEKFIKVLQDAIDEEHEDDHVSPEDLLGLKWRLSDAYKEEEVYWKLKRREQWLEEGDRNTKYFHASAKKRRKRNRILGLLENIGS